MDQTRGLTIGDVAHRSGVAASAIRYYESRGLLPPPPRVHGERRYDDGVLDSLAFIAVAQAAGFALREIEVLVGHVTSGPGLAATMRTLSEQKLGEVEEILERTRAMKDWLQVAKECTCTDAAECALFPVAGELPGREPLALISDVPSDCRRPS